MSLNAEQSEAALCSGAAPLLVLAGPGSGKTLTLLHRVLHLAPMLPPGARVLLLTFSKAAVSEMETRLLAHSVSSDVCHVMTFHKFALGLVKSHPVEAGFTSIPRVATNKEKLALLKHCIESSSLDDARTLLENKKRMLGALKHLQDAKRRGEFGDDRSRELYAAYSALLHSKGLVDFEDMVPAALGLLSRHPSALARLQSVYSHVLCDEFQDTNARQRDLLFRLGASGRITAVGDANQLIYGFQGADPTNFSAFMEEFRHLSPRLVRLRINYRSVGPIVEVCNAIIRAGCSEDEAPPLSMVPAAGSETGERVQVVECMGAEDCELRCVQQRVERWLGEGRFAASDVAVLCRDNESAARLAEHVRAHSTAFSCTAAVGDPEDEAEEGSSSSSSACVAKLRLVADPADSDACAQALPAEVAESPAVRVALDRSTAGLAHGSLLGALRVVPPTAKLSNWLRGIDKLVATMADNAVTLTNFVEKVLQSCGEGGSKRKQPGASSAHESLKSSAAAWLGARRRQHGVSLGEQVRQFLLDLSSGGIDAPSTSAGICARPSVWVGTIHRAKGRQWGAVLVQGASDQAFGSADKTAAQLSDDRRLLYVAASRAERLLCFSFVGAYSSATQRNKLCSAVSSARGLSCVSSTQFPPSDGTPTLAGAANASMSASCTRKGFQEYSKRDENSGVTNTLHGRK